MADAIRQLGISEVTFKRWRKEYAETSRDQLRRLKERGKKNERLHRAVSDLTLDKAAPQGGRPRKLLSPSRRRQCINHVHGRLAVSERRACQVLGQHRSTQRRVLRSHDDQDRLVSNMVDLACPYGRYGYRRISVLLRAVYLPPPGTSATAIRKSVRRRIDEYLHHGRQWPSIRQPGAYLELQRALADVLGSTAALSLSLYVSAGTPCSWGPCRD